MGVVTSLFGIVVILAIVSSIYVESSPELTFDNVQELVGKMVDTYRIWKV